MLYKKANTFIPVHVYPTEMHTYMYMFQKTCVCIITYNSSNSGASPMLIYSRMDKEAVGHTPSGVQSREKIDASRNMVGSVQEDAWGKKSATEPCGMSVRM